MMNSIKCPECGFVDFSSAGECKRCKVRFHRPEPISGTSSSEIEAPHELKAEDQQKATIAPLSDYFNAEPAPFSVPVIIFAILLVITVLGVASELRTSLAFMNSSKWFVMTGRAGVSHISTSILEPLVYMDLIIKSAVLIAALALLILLLRKSWSFVKWVRVYLLANLLYQAFELVALLSLRASLTAKNAPEPFNLLFDYRMWIAYALFDFVAVSLTLIWYAYFGRSERAKKIFIN